MQQLYGSIYILTHEILYLKMKLYYEIISGPLSFGHTTHIDSKNKR